jgi:hypothetical protein
MCGRPQFREQVIDVFPVGLAGIVQRQPVFPEQEPEERTLKHVRRDVTAVIAVGQRRQMHMAIDELFVTGHGSIINRVDDNSRIA